MPVSCEYKNAVVGDLTIGHNSINQIGERIAEFLDLELETNVYEKTKISKWFRCSVWFRM